MRIIRAEFQNFRLLRDLELQFSMDPKRKLTVIRAANETGKTTILNALQWALYGDNALPNKGEDYRLHPIDWDDSEKTRVPVTVTVDFELTRLRKGPSGPIETRRNYRIVRSAFEEVHGKNWQRSASTVKLFEMGDQGASAISDPEAVINDGCHPNSEKCFSQMATAPLASLKQRFRFQRNASACSAPYAPCSGWGSLRMPLSTSRRPRRKSTKRPTDRFRRQTQRNCVAVGADENEVTRLEADLEDAKQQFATFDEKVSEIDKKIETTLQKGDKERLPKGHGARPEANQAVGHTDRSSQQGALTTLSQRRAVARSFGTLYRVRVPKACRPSRPGKNPKHDNPCS